MLPTAPLLAQQLQAGEPLAVDTSNSYIEIHVVDQYEKGIPDAEIVLAGQSYNANARGTDWTPAIVIPWEGQPLIPLWAHVVVPGQEPQPVLLDLNESSWLEVRVTAYEERHSHESVPSHIEGYKALKLNDFTLHYRPDSLPAMFVVRFAESPRGSMDKSNMLEALRWHEMQAQVEIDLFTLEGDELNTDEIPLVLEFQQTLPEEAFDVSDLYRWFQTIEAAPDTDHNVWLTGWRRDKESGVWHPHPNASFTYYHPNKALLMTVPGLSTWTISGTPDEVAQAYYEALGMPYGPTGPTTTGTAPADPETPEVSDNGKSCTILGDGVVGCQGKYGGLGYTISEGAEFAATVSSSLEAELSSSLNIKGSALARALVDIEGQLGARFKGTLSGGATATTTMAKSVSLTPGQSALPDVLTCSTGPIQLVMVNKVYSVVGITVIEVPLYPSTVWELTQTDDCCTVGYITPTVPCCDLHEYKSKSKSCGE